MAYNMTGLTVAFGTSSYAAEYIGANGEAFRAAMAAAHMGTSGAIPKILGDLVDQGDVRFRIWFDPDTPPPVSGASETVTITFKLQSGQTTAANLAGPAGVTRSSWEASVEALGSGEFSLTWTDDYTWTAST